MATPITPHTSVYLLKCPLETDNQHQLTFASKAAQHNYFNSLPKIELDNFSYQRHDGVIRVNEHIDDIIQYNYVMYQNSDYSDKWFYAFITGMEYINDNCTYVSIKTDTFQTWWFDLSFKRCFVEREHVSNDAFGLHTLDEGIPAGEFVCNGVADCSIATNPKKCYIAVLISELAPSMVSTYGNQKRMYSGVPNGCYLLLLDLYTSGNILNFENVDNFIRGYDSIGKGDAIIAMYLIPEEVFSNPTPQMFSFEIGDYGFDAFIPEESTSIIDVKNYTTSMNATINGYTPKNNKCFTKQFNYLMVSNNNGASTNYYWEDFQSANDKNPVFKLYATLSQNLPTKIVPTNYKNATNTNGFGYGLAGSAFPSVSWNSDYYLNWQAKNGFAGVQQRADAMANKEYKNKGNNPLEFLGEFFEDFGLGVQQELKAIGGVISGSMADAERTPNQVAGDTTGGDLVFSAGKTCFTFYKMSMKAEVARIVDDYFSGYGYKVSTWKIPNFTGRRNWNFVKLSQVNVVADIPQEDLEEIKSNFIKGITLWHNPSTFMDYSQDNSIV
jgi:hypothetical protein